MYVVLIQVFPPEFSFCCVCVLYCCNNMYVQKRFFLCMSEKGEYILARSVGGGGYPTHITTTCVLTYRPLSSQHRRKKEISKT